MGGKVPEVRDNVYGHDVGLLPAVDDDLPGVGGEATPQVLVVVVVPREKVNQHWVEQGELTVTVQCTASKVRRLTRKRASGSDLMVASTLG